MNMNALLSMLMPMIPQFIQAAMTIAQSISSSAETPDQVKAHYARIAAALDATNALVQSAPLPPVGSGR